MAKGRGKSTQNTERRSTAKMPPAKRAKFSKSPENDSDGNVDSSSSGEAEQTSPPAVTRKVAKPSYQQEPEELGGEMRKMLDMFGVEKSKSIVKKKARLEEFTESSIRTSGQKIESLMADQQVERKNLTDEFSKQVLTVFNQWHTDLEKAKTQEEKLESLLKQEMKLFQQTRIVQTQRMKSLKQLHDSYDQNAKEMDTTHKRQLSTVQSELKKEMALLQKKILMDNQQQEMDNVRKSLQSMLK